MPTGSRIRADNVFGTLTDNPLLVGATTMNGAGLANLPAVTSNHAVIVLDPLRTAGAPEIVIVTAHTAAATSATITRGAYGTTARQHAAGVLWIHAPTIEDTIRIVTSSTRPSDPYRGQVAFETDTGRWIARTIGDVWAPAPVQVPACRVYHNANQSIPDAAETTLAFNSERYDTDAMHDPVTNNSRITLNTPGLYLVTLSANIATAADYNSFYLAIRLNGATFIAIQASNPSLQGGVKSLVVATTYKFAAADYVEARVLHDNTANVARNVEVLGNYTPEFSATWVGIG